MIGTKPIEKIIELTLASGYVQGERPLSLLLIASPESGKSESLLRFRGTDKVMFIGDITTYGVTNHIIPQIIAGSIKHLIFPDFLKVLTRGRRISDELLSLLNILIEEGVSSSIFTKNISFQYPEDKERKYCGVIIALTRSALESRKDKLKKLGFLSRVLPFYFLYVKEDIEKIHETIKTGGVKENGMKLKFPKEPMKVQLNKSLADKLDPVVELLKEPVGGYTSFRSRKQLQTLLKSNALINKRKEVIEEDLIEIMALIPFIYNPVMGDQCTWLILKSLPGTYTEIVDRLKSEYSESTVHRRLKTLYEKQLINLENNTYTTILQGGVHSNIHQNESMQDNPQPTTHNNKEGDVCQTHII